MAEKKKAIQMNSPRGVLRYPRLGEPDFGNDQYPKPDGEYSVQLVLRADDPATQAFIAKLQPHYDAAIANGEAAFKNLKVETRKKLGKAKANSMFTVQYDKETEEPTGEIVFKFTMKAGGEFKKGPKAGQRWSRKPSIFDAKRNPMDGKKVWGGSTGIVVFEIGVDKDGNTGYFIPGTGAMGLKLGLCAAQVINLVQGGNRSAADYGLEEVEDGYEDDGQAVEAEKPSRGTSEPDQEGSTQSSSDASDNSEDF
jgi:hypothetical protein